jgi:hypothetical protein
VLDHLVVQAAVRVDGIDTSEPIVVQATRDVVEPTPPTYATADGNRFGAMHSRDTDASGRYVDWWFSGQWGDWTVMVDLTAPDGTSVPESELARVASLFAAHETADGFLVLDPQAPMHVVPGPGAGIVLDQVSVITSEAEIRVVPPRADVQVRRL